VPQPTTLPLAPSESRVLQIIFGSEATGGWRELHNEELHNLYSSNIIIAIK
jgi:hypothetical protein